MLVYEDNKGGTNGQKELHSIYVTELIPFRIEE